MIGEIMQAVIDECKKFYEGKGGTFILKTDYDSTQLTNYTMPLCLFDVVEAPDSYQFIGGATNMGWLFAMNSYNYSPNPTAEDDGGYSSSLLNVVDDIRRHFSIGIWLTAGMTAIAENYANSMMLSGVMPGDALDRDGLIKGFKVMFDTASIDTDTASVKPSTEVLETVTQICYPPTS